MKLISTVFMIVVLNLVFSEKRRKKGNNCKNILNRQIIENLKAQNILKSEAVEKVFCEVNRLDFMKNSATTYGLYAFPIGYGATISKPNVHVFALEKALEKFDTESNINILDIGSGSGIL